MNRIDWQDGFPMPPVPSPKALARYLAWEDDEDPCLFLTQEDIDMMREQDLKAMEEFVNGKEANNG